VKVTNKELRNRIRIMLLNENYAYDSNLNPIDNIKNLKMAKLNLKDSISALHDLTSAISTDQIIKTMLARIKPMQTMANLWSDVTINNKTYNADSYWALTNAPNNAPFSKLSEGVDTTAGPLKRMSDDVINGNVTLQKVLSFLEDTSYVKKKEDGHEVFAAIFCKTVMKSKDFIVTPSAEKGVDVRSLDGTISIEVKGSEKDTPQTMFSGTLPKQSTTHYYVFLCTDQSYIVRSDLLRTFYLVPDTTQEDYFETFFKSGFEQDLQAQGIDIDALDSFQNFLINLDPGDPSFSSIKKTDYEDFMMGMTNADNNVKLLYNKVLSEIESQTEVLAATLTQSLLGFTGKERVSPPQINVSGFYVYLRPVLKGQKFQSTEMLELDPVRPGALASKNITRKGDMSSGMANYINRSLNDIVDAIKRRYNYATSNNAQKIKILDFIETTLIAQYDKVENQIANDSVTTYERDENSKRAAKLMRAQAAYDAEKLANPATRKKDPSKDPKYLDVRQSDLDAMREEIKSVISTLFEIQMGVIHQDKLNLAGRSKTRLYENILQKILYTAKKRR